MTNINYSVILGSADMENRHSTFHFDWLCIATHSGICLRNAVSAATNILIIIVYILSVQ